MSFAVPSSSTGVQAQYRSYDRGNCSWFVPAQTHGTLQATVVDSIFGSALPTANTASSCSIVLSAAGPWTIEHTFKTGGRAVFPNTTTPRSTFDLYRFSRTYSIWESGSLSIQTIFFDTSLAMTPRTVL
jgi:hypothetical protein